MTGVKVVLNPLCQCILQGAGKIENETEFHPENQLQGLRMAVA
jgi:hypothetical protein